MDPTLKTNTLTALKERFAGLSPQSKVAAKYVIDHPSDFGLDPIRDTARKAGVSTYTLVNLAKALGFEGFEPFRAPFRHALVSSPKLAVAPARWDDFRRQSDTGHAFSEAAENAISIVMRSLEQQDLPVLEQVVDLLLSARTVYLTAVRSSFAAAYYFHYVGRMALPTLELIPHHMNSPIDDLNYAGADDILVAITVTPYSRETIEACAYAKQKGMRLVLITDSEAVAADLAPEATIITSVQSTHSFGCISGMIATIEALIAVLMQRGGGEARERIYSYERLRSENNAYWVAKK